MLSCCCVTGYDYPDVYVPRIIKARKEHTCDECGEAIRPGTLYEHVRGLWDGVWSTHRTCHPCVLIRRDFFSCGFIHGEMREHFSECNGFDYVDGPDDEDEDAE